MRPIEVSKKCIPYGAITAAAQGRRGGAVRMRRWRSGRRLGRSAARGRRGRGAGGTGSYMPPVSPNLHSRRTLPPSSSTTARIKAPPLRRPRSSGSPLTSHPPQLERLPLTGEDPAAARCGVEIRGRSGLRGWGGGARGSMTGMGRQLHLRLFHPVELRVFTRRRNRDTEEITRSLRLEAPHTHGSICHGRLNSSKK
jgi:hypothetical protein